MTRKQVRLFRFVICEDSWPWKGRRRSPTPAAAALGRRAGAVRRSVACAPDWTGSSSNSRSWRTQTPLARPCRCGRCSGGRWARSAGLARRRRRSRRRGRRRRVRAAKSDAAAVAAARGRSSSPLVCNPNASHNDITRQLPVLKILSSLIIFGVVSDGVITNNRNDNNHIINLSP